MALYGPQRRSRPLLYNPLFPTGRTKPRLKNALAGAGADDDWSNSLRLDTRGAIFYLEPMTKLLDEAIAEIRRLPPEQQDDIGRYLLQLASEEPLEAGAIAALDEAEAQIARGEVVRGEDLKAFWRSLLS